MKIDNRTLLTSYKLNDLLTLKNRIVMAPMTRVQAQDDFVPTQAMADYYSKRADAGLIVTEGTIISPDARGHNNVPGIFNHAQITGWQKVTDAVHVNGGLIFLQLWHVGRVSHPKFLEGKLPISASATTMVGKLSRSDGLMHGESRAATTLEILELVDAFRQAAKNAMAAGFDGIEIHGANGYLIDQFLHYHTNLRTDEYGGTPENKARFALEVVKACGEAIGFERTGLRLSPGAYLNEVVGDDRDAAVFIYLLEQLNHFPLAYVHTGNFNDAQQFKELGNKTMTAFMREHYQGTIVAAGGYDVQKAVDGIFGNEFDLAAIGRPFIANPDLIKKIENNEAILSYDISMLKTLN